MGKSGGGPMCGIGMARRGVETGGREIGEGGANGIAECAGYIGADGFEFSPRDRIRCGGWRRSGERGER